MCGLNCEYTIGLVVFIAFIFFYSFFLFVVKFSLQKPPSSFLWVRFKHKTYQYFLNRRHKKASSQSELTNSNQSRLEQFIDKDEVSQLPDDAINPLTTTTKWCQQPIDNDKLTTRWYEEALIDNKESTTKGQLRSQSRRKASTAKELSGRKASTVKKWSRKRASTAKEQSVKNAWLSIEKSL